MGLLGLLKRLKLQSKQIQICLLGLEGSGKTTIVRHLFNEPADDVRPSNGFEIRPLQIQDITISVYDVGGSQQNRSFWRNYFETSDVLIWVIDSTNRDKIEESRKELETLLQSDRNQSTPLLIVASKQDCQEPLSLQEISSYLGCCNDPRRQWNAIHCGNNDFSQLEKGLRWIIDVCFRQAAQ